MRKTMISFVIDADVLSRLDAAAQADDKSRSQVLRDAVERFVDEQRACPLTLDTEEVSQ